MKNQEKICKIKPDALEPLEKEILYKFKNLNLLQNALNHPSILNPYKKSNDKSKNFLGSYEKLEFLGDKVLNLIIAELLFNLFSNNNEGELSLKLNYLVSGKIISQIGSEINLMKYINISSCLKKNILNNAQKNIIEDCMEAIIGAIYLDGGFEDAKKSVSFLWKSKIEEGVDFILKDCKTKLQEILQKNGYKLPEYNVLKNEGSDHEPMFHIELNLMDEKFPKFYSKGRTLKIAQSEAAAQAVQFLSKQKLK